jgi:hypothetical protein
MRRPNPANDRQYRYKLHLTVDQTDAARPSILVNRHSFWKPTPCSRRRSARSPTTRASTRK